MRRPYFLSGFILLIAAILMGFAIRAEAKTAAEIFNGGTGTSTAPAYGQLLIGGKNGEYEFAASSTLGSTAIGFSTTSAAYWLTQQSTTNLSEGSNLYFTGARAISALTGQSNSLFTNGAGYLTSLAGAASSTLLTDSNTFSGSNTFGTTTATNVNGQIFVNGWPYSQNSTGIQEANDSCYISGCTQVLLANGTYDITAPINLSTSTVLIGQTRDGVILLQNSADISSMVFNMIQAKGFYAQHVAISNLTLDGNYDNLGSHPGSRGTLIGPSDYWTIENVLMQNSNANYTFPNGTNYVTYKNNIFRKTGNCGANCGSTADVMGGGANNHMLVDNNTWETGLRGNLFDNVNGDSNTLVNNHFYATGTASVIFEGMTNTTFSNNEAPSLSVGSNAGYHPAFIQNATGTIVTFNRFVSTTGNSVCVALNYTATTTGDFNPGGSNTITNNKCSYGQSGYVKYMQNNSADGGGDNISNNSCYDINIPNNESVNNGSGAYNPSCINIMQGATTTVDGNTSIDDFIPMHTRYVVQFGAPGGTAIFPNSVTAIGNIGQSASGTVDVASPTHTTLIGVFDGISTTTSSNGVNITGGCFAINGNCLTQNSGTVIGSGNSGRVAFWNGASSLSNDANFVYDNASHSLGIGGSSFLSALRANRVDNSQLILSSTLNQVNASSSIDFRYNNGGNNNIARITGYTESGGGGDLLFETAANGSGPYLEKMRLSRSGFVGIGTSTPGSLLSLNNIANFTAATSTFYGSGGINLAAGCYAIGGSCLTQNSGTVTSVATTYPVTGGTFTTSGTIALAFGTTTSNTWSGTQTFTNTPVFSSLGAGTVNSLSNGTIYNSATSTPGLSAPITYSGTLGQFIGGASGNFGCTTASSGVTGCLSGTDWTTFNNKRATISATWPVTFSANTVGFNGLSTTSPWINGNLAEVSGGNLTSIATTTQAFSGPFTLSATQG